MNKSPFSGDVMQDIVTFWTLSWKWLLNSSSQFGFININNMESSDPELEENVVENVASYGKQLGRIIELLSVVIMKVDLGGLTPSQDKAVKDFLELARKISDLKEKKGSFSPVPRAHDMEQLLIDIRYFKKYNPEVLEKVIQELHNG